MSEPRKLRMLSDGMHNAAAVATPRGEYLVDQQPLSYLQRYTQAYIEGVYDEATSLTNETFAEPVELACPCASTF